MIKVIRYDQSKERAWNEFVEKSKGHHFMFIRNFMEYHADRFLDSSLMFYDKKERLIALLPANRSENILYSHQGLTFGGLITDPKVTAPDVISIFESILLFCKSENVDKVIYKRMPDFYNSTFAQDDLYALFRCGAKLFRRDLNATVDLTLPYSYSKGRKWAVNKAKKESLEVVGSDNFDLFWPVLIEVLSRHDAIPSHTLDEIKRLNALFPENIKLFLAVRNDVVLAGTVLFITKHVIHTQYMATTEKGKDVGALDYLISHLMKDKYSNKHYFNFGISTEQAGTVLNEGLLAQKNGFGAKSTVHDFYEINIQ